MTVHMFRCFIGRGKMSTVDLESRIDDWVTSNAEWVDDSAAHTLAERTTQNDGTGDTYYAIDVRFLPDESKANLQQKFTDKLVNKVDWYRIGYHACTHRDGDSTTETETRTLEPGTQVELDYLPVSGTISIGSAGYDEGVDYNISGHTMEIEDGASIPSGEYQIVYETKQCGWDDQTEWTAKDVTIPSHIPTME